jgi:enamine deaminase RidA (YjgF/YER057c/UK114 family)
MSKRLNISSATPWEDKVGYSRAVRIGNTIEVSGTTAVDGDKIIGSTVYEQAKFIFEKIEVALRKADALMNDVIRTRTYITDISKWEEAAKAHAEVFRDIKPAATMVEVSRLIDPALLIEIEVTAVLEN